MGSKNSQENKDPIEIVSNDNSEEIIDPIVIKFVSEDFQIVDRGMHFSQQHGNEELDQSLMIATEKLLDKEINNGQHQKRLTIFTNKLCL